MSANTHKIQRGPIRIAWPELSYGQWRETAAGLQLWMQMVGKVRLQLTPWLNHSWQVPFYVTARGLSTSPIPFGEGVFDLEFDFISHRLAGRDSAGRTPVLPLKPMSAAEFHGGLMMLLAEFDVRVAISPMPSELAGAVPFPEDRAPRPYDARSVERFWQVLIGADRLFKLFRTQFLGKASPSHFFWGGFDLAVTRFSGRPAPRHPGGIPGLSDRVTREAYSHEVSSAGFWPGNEAFPHAAFYSYAYPEPKGFRAAKLPPGTDYDDRLGEFILPYEIARNAQDTDGLILEFLQAAYVAAADAGKWDRASLECAMGIPNRPRPLE